MITRKRLLAESAFGDFVARERKRYRLVDALLGRNDGTIYTTEAHDYVYARLRASPRQVVRVKLLEPVQPVAGLPIAVREYRSTGGTRYIYAGRAEIIYADDPFAATIGAHADQHARGDYGTGGFDPVNIYGRMFSEQRAQAQDPADMTVYVTAGGYWDADGVWQDAEGETSPEFTAPGAGYQRIDLLYRKTDLTLAIAQGAAVIGTPGYPDKPTDCLRPIAFVALQDSTTEITDALIRDAAGFAGVASAGGGLTQAQILIRVSLRG